MVPVSGFRKLLLSPLVQPCLSLTSMMAIKSPTRWYLLSPGHWAK